MKNKKEETQDERKNRKCNNKTKNKIKVKQIPKEYEVKSETENKINMGVKSKQRHGVKGKLYLLNQVHL